MAALNATPGSATANAYLTAAEADLYFETRLPLSPPWDEAEDPEAALMMATRTLDAMAMPYKYLVPATSDVPAHYRTRPQWTGTPASSTQRLAWPRIGMFDGNGNPIPSNVIPEELKEAVAEFAGQLLKSDTTLDNDVIVQGLTGVRAGSVGLTFKDMIEQHVIPDMVWNLMPSSWFTDELYTPAMTAQFDVFGGMS